MNSSSMRDGTAIAQQYLKQATALRLQLLAAMDAIAHNSLPDFEQSLWQQEMLSSGMRRSLQLMQHLYLQPSLLSELRSANASLQQLSRTYQGLIGQASQSAALLRGVCTLYGQATSPAHNQQPLCCEA